MCPFLELVKARLNTDYDTLFRMAYIWKFGLERHVGLDVITYMRGGPPAPYMTSFLEHIKNVQELPSPT